MPWCIKKCPYCDFNSHQLSDTLPEQSYIDALIADLHDAINIFGMRSLETIFIGGGTPSLISPEAYRRLFDTCRQYLVFDENIEITIEVNPGAVDQAHLQGYYDLGINRLSLGVQSFDDVHLNILGRVHNVAMIREALTAIRAIGFKMYNIDLMYGLPGQTASQAVFDLEQALSFNPPHLSWYQLTLEPNTVFYNRPPAMPSEEAVVEIETLATSLLANFGYQRYEISSFCQPSAKSRHNYNYWQFGDYLGIGAGSHSKITSLQGVLRFEKARQPKSYMQNPLKSLKKRIVEGEDLAFEYMLMVSRLYQPLLKSDFTRRTGLDWTVISAPYRRACHLQMMTDNSAGFQVTDFGHRYLNDLQALFLPDY